MKTHFIASILAMSFVILSSCNRDIKTVFEVYVTFKNSEENSQISLNPYLIYYGTLDKQTMKPANQGSLSIDRNALFIKDEKLESKIFVTSLSEWFGEIGYLSLIGDMSYTNDNIKNEGGINMLFPIDFEPESGEAYEVNFIIDIKNSMIKKDNYFYFELGGDSRVVITKY